MPDIKAFKTHTALSLKDEEKIKTCVALSINENLLRSFDFSSWIRKFNYSKNLLNSCFPREESSQRITESLPVTQQ